ncbi:hypothetical protein JOD43_001113 [Pullulanibacillus pueri]|nr:DUF2642 domain-containing protein [Pullulanibacillus pueri]MBM7680947.1 hypothetical protein [Pullulanibacillus pueri]
MNLLNQLNQQQQSGLNLDLSFLLDGSLNLSRSGSTTPTPTPTTPTSISELLESLVGQQVQLTTPFDTITGTLIAVRSDYVVVVENSGDQVLVKLDKIELVTETQ